MHVTDYVFLNENRVPISEWEGVDPKLRRIIEEAARRSGTKVEIRSGAEKRRRSGSAHNRGLAIDLWLIDENGNRIPHGAGGINQASARGAAEGFGAYEEFAKVAREVQKELYPELEKAFRWGGYFSGDPNRYGSLDTMQFDLAGSSRLGMAGGSWETGLTNEQRRLWENAGYQISSGGGPVRAPTRRPMSRQDKFYQSMLPGVLEASRRTGVDPRIIMAQAALETGYGKSAPNNNYFGIKSHGRVGGSNYATTEVVNGKPVRTTASFRGYDSPEESALDYADFLNTNPRYNALLEADGLEAQLAALQASGYATDPNYSSKLASIIEGMPTNLFEASGTVIGSGNESATPPPSERPRNTVAALAQDFGQEIASSPMGRDVGTTVREATKRAGNALIDNPIIRGIQDNVLNADYKIGRQQALAMLEGSSPAAAALAAQQDFFTKGAPIEPGGAYPPIPFPRKNRQRPPMQGPMPPEGGVPINPGGPLENPMMPVPRPPNPNNAPYGIQGFNPPPGYNPDMFPRRTDDPLQGSTTGYNPDTLPRRIDNPAMPPGQVPVAGNGEKGGIDAILAQMAPNIVPSAGGELTPQGMIEEYAAAIEEMNTPYQEPSRMFGRFSPALMGIGTALSQIGAGESVDLSAVMEAEARRRREKEAYRLRQLQLAKQKFDAALAARGMTVDEEQFERTAGFREAEIGLGRDRLGLKQEQHALDERKFAAEQERLAREAEIAAQQLQQDEARRAAQAEQNAALTKMLLGGGGGQPQPQSDSMLLSPKSIGGNPAIGEQADIDLVPPPFMREQPQGILGGDPNDLGLHPAEIAATAAQLTDPEANGGKIVADLIGAGQERNVEMRGQDLRYQSSTNDLLERRRVDLADRQSAKERRVSNRVFAEALQQNAIQHGMYSQARAIGDILDRLDPDRGITDEQFATIEQLATPPDSIRETTAIANITGATQQEAFRTAFPSPEQQGVMDQKLGMIKDEFSAISEKARSTKDLVPALEGLKDTITHAMDEGLDISGPAVSFFGPFTNLVSDTLGVNKETIKTRQQFEAFAARLFPNLPRTPGATSNIDVQKISQQIADANTTEEAALAAVNGMLSLAKRYQAYEQHMRGYESVADFDRRRQEWVDMEEAGDLRTQPVIFRISFDADNLWKAYQRGLIDQNTILYDRNGNAFTKESSRKIMNEIIELQSE